MPLSVILPDGSVERPSLGSGDPIDSFASELRAAAHAVATRETADQLSGRPRATRPSSSAWQKSPASRPVARSKLRDSLHACRAERPSFLKWTEFVESDFLNLVRSLSDHHERTGGPFIWRGRRSLMMTLATSELIHPTAVIDPEAMLAAGRPGRPVRDH